MRPYADTNFFVKLYLALPDSQHATTLLDEARSEDASPLPITWLHRLEVVNAVQLQVFAARIRGQPRITAEQAAAAQASFREDLRRTDFLRITQLIHEKLAAKFEEISLRHTARLGVRVYDVIHVASALLLDCDTFWSFDAKALRLAKLEGLAIRS
jgi:predicted nucleic acid-binding protein